jgi:hypothetical protein
MVRHAGIVFGFFNEILRTPPLVVEPREHGDPAAHIRDEYAVAVLRRVERLILFGLLRRCWSPPFSEALGPIFAWQRPAASPSERTATAAASWDDVRCCYGAFCGSGRGQIHQNNHRQTFPQLFKSTIQD